MREYAVVDALGVLTGMLAIVTPVILVFIIFRFRHLRYVQRQQTIRMAIEKGIDISPLLAKEVAQPADPHRYTLRGLLWGIPGIAIGLGVTLAAMQHGARAFAIIGWIPAAIGAAYLIFDKFVASHDRNKADTENSLPPAARYAEAPPTQPSVKE